MVLTEFAKVGAFVRRDFLTALTYKAGFVSDWISLFVTAFLFYFTGRLVDPAKLPSYGGSRATYLEFVLIGIVLGFFVQIALSRVASVMRQEQFGGTLEVLLMTPTAPFTVQLGSVMYDLLLIPIRLAVFAGIVAVTFGLNFKASGILPAAVYVVLTIPFVWGLGLVSAGLMMTLRRGGGVVTLGVGLLTLASGAYFPLSVLPAALRELAKANPLAIAIGGMRNALLGGSGWSGVPGDVALLMLIGAISLTLGTAVFRHGVRRERRLGTLGLY
jgi:ABC-2 type transport system permease protein